MSKQNENITGQPDEAPPTAPAAGGAAPDPFDVNALRLSPTLTNGMGVKKALVTVPVRKPDRSWFVRVHPDPEYRLTTAVVELKDDRGETYLVDAKLWDGLAGESTFSPRALFTAVNRQGTLFVWPVKLPGPDGRVEEWSRSASEAVEMATKGWVRVQANMNLGAYETFRATGDLPDPDWPDTPFPDILRIAFKDRFISSRDHSVLRRLRGEI